MIDLIRKSLLAGLGAGAVTAETLRRTMDRLVDEGRLREDEASRLVEEMLEEGRDHLEELQGSLTDAIRRAVEAAGIARAAELEALRERVAALEERLDALEPGDEPSGERP
ncbi:MAG: hypothetical protein PVF68_17240 [Acidobacteriota bacterium]|jgi:polyhydroxyalkanoate synthesis regulator phasin